MLLLEFSSRTSPTSPVVDRRDHHRGVTNLKLVEPRGDRSPPLELVEHALHRVPLLVVLVVHLRWPSTRRALRCPVSGVVLLVRDRRADTSPTQQTTVARGGVGLVAADSVRTSARPPHPTRTLDTNLLQDRAELRAVTRCPAVTRPCPSASAPAPQRHGPSCSTLPVTGQVRDQPARCSYHRAVPSAVLNASWRRLHGR